MRAFRSRSLQDDVDHPLQAIADLMTVREKYGTDLRGMKFLVVVLCARVRGPLSVAQGLISLLPRFGVGRHAGAPEGVQFDAAVR